MRKDKELAKWLAISLGGVAVTMLGLFLLELWLEARDLHKWWYDDATTDDDRRQFINGLREDGITVPPEMYDL